MRVNMIFGFLGAGKRRLAVIVNEFGPVARIFNFHLWLWFFIVNRRGTWHDIARVHEVMTAGVVDAVQRRAPEAAEAAMTAYIAGRHQDIRDWL